MRRPFAVAATLLVLVGCASTQLTSVWKDPSAGSAPMKKIMVLAMGRDQSLRRVAEDTFVRNLPKGVVGVPSYQTIEDESKLDAAAAKQMLQQAGCDGAAVYRLVSVENETRYVPGTTYVSAYPYYGTFGGYWGYAAPVVYEPGYLVQDQIVQIECNVYRLSDEKLVWSARSETVNPGSAQQVIDEVVMHTVTQLHSDKVL